MRMKTLSKIFMTCLTAVLVYAIGCGDDSDDSANDPTPEVPAITGLDVSTGAPGDAVVATGEFLGDIRSINFDGVAATIGNSSSATQIYFDVPVPNEYGATTISFVFDDVTLSQNFTVTRATPTVSAVWPEAVAKGEKVLVTGTGFYAVSGVSIGGAAVSDFVVSESGDAIRFFTPDVASGPVEVTNDGGTGSGPNLTVDQTHSVLLLSDFDGNGVFPNVADETGEIQYWTAGGDVLNEDIEATGDDAVDGNYLKASTDGLNWVNGPYVQAGLGEGTFAIPQTDSSKVFVEAWVNLTQEEPGVNGHVFWYQVAIPSWDQYYSIENILAPDDYTGGEWTKISVAASDLVLYWNMDQADNPIVLDNLAWIRVVVSLYNETPTTLRVDNIQIRYEDM